MLFSEATVSLVQVNKAQNAQKGLNPSRSKDEKGTEKPRSARFFLSALCLVPIFAALVF